MFSHLGLADLDQGYAWSRRIGPLYVLGARWAVKLALVRRHQIGYRYVAWSWRWRIGHA